MFTYRGHQAKDGPISAGAILTMDQYNDDQIVALQYSQRGLQKQQGLTFFDRPDTMGPALRTLYSVPTHSRPARGEILSASPSSRRCPQISCGPGECSSDATRLERQ